jgi:ankyrin repeat protein
MTTTPNNLAQLASNSTLTLDQIHQATLHQLQHDLYVDCSVIYWASGRCNVEIVKAILDKGIDVNSLSDGNQTALLSAAYYKKWDIIEYLLSRGADPRLFDVGNTTVLHYAVEKNAPEHIVNILIEAGADAGALTLQGKTPSDIARANYYINLAELIDQYKKGPAKSANFLA